MRKLRAGIVGCGGIANGKHLPAMQKSGLYEVVAFCDIIIEPKPFPCRNLYSSNGGRKRCHV